MRNFEEAKNIFRMPEGKMELNPKDIIPRFAIRCLEARRCDYDKKQEREPEKDKN